MTEKQNTKPLDAVKELLLGLKEQHENMSTEHALTHPPTELLEDLRNGFLPQEMVTELNAHLLGCSSCRTLYSDLHLEDSLSVQAAVDETLSEAATTMGQPSIAIAEPEEPTFSTEHTTTQDTGASWWSMTSQWTGLVAGLVLLVGVGSWWWDGPGQMKGDIQKFERKQILLLAKPEPTSNKVALLKQGATLTTKDSLFFGFTPAKQGGFLYLFRIVARAKEMPELLFPFTPKKPVHFVGSKLTNLERNGKPMRYPLTAEQGTIKFVLLQLSRPLSPTEIATLIQRKNGWTQTMAVLKGLKLPSLFVDSFIVRVRN